MFNLIILVYTNKQMHVVVYLDPRRVSSTLFSAESRNHDIKVKIQGM